MADSEKGGSSTKEAKAKTSLLDEDFSKGFLSSWKSMSATGGDDMDFNFEPVRKGKKKAFDFDMDMDFSLDDSFGKMPSFKIDMPDLDFSSSPKKSTKSKEKPEEDSAKGNRLDKHDNFNFSFDFNGLDDFSLDAPSTKGGKSPSREKKNKNNDSEFEHLRKRVNNDKKEAVEDSISKGPAVYEDAAFSITEDLVVDDIPPVRSVNCASKSSALSYPVQLTELDKNHSSSETELTDNNSHKTDHQTHQEGEAFTNKSCSPGREGILDPISVDRPPQSIGSSIPADSAEVHVPSGIEKTSLLSREDEFQPKEEKSSIQSHIQFKDVDLSSNTPLVEASVQPNASEGLQISSPERKVSKGSSEVGIVAGELPAAVGLTSATEKPILDKSSQECSIVKIKINDGKNELGNSGNLGTAKLLLGTAAPYATCDTKALSSDASSSAEMQIPILKVSSASIGSGPSAAKAMLMKNRVPGVTHSNFSIKQAAKGRAELSSYENNKDFSTHTGAVDRSYVGRKHNEKKSDDNPNSCAKESIKPDSVLEKSENIAAANSPPRNEEDTLIRKDRKIEMSVDTEHPEGSEAKNGLPSPECEKMASNVKSSGLKNPSLTSPEEGTIFGIQEQGKLKDKISSISSFQKLNISQGNKLSSQRIEKKMLALPSQKLTRSIATDKQLATPPKQRIFGSMGNFEKSTRPQAASNMVSPVSAEKQTSSNLSLKRKASEAADMDPAKLQMSRHVSPNESRMSKASARGLEEGDQPQGNFLEGSRKNVSVDCTTPKYDFDQEANIEALQFSMMVENDKNVEKAEACAKELDSICNMLKKKHEEAKELLVRALVNNNYLLMLNHPIYEEKIRAVQRIASRLMTKEVEVEA